MRLVAGWKGWSYGVTVTEVERQEERLLYMPGRQEVVLEEGTGSLLSRFSFRGTEVLTGAEPVLLLEEHDKGRKKSLCVSENIRRLFWE